MRGVSLGLRLAWAIVCACAAYSTMLAPLNSAENPNSRIYPLPPIHPEASVQADPATLSGSGRVQEDAVQSDGYFTSRRQANAPEAIPLPEEHAAGGGGVTLAELECLGLSSNPAIAEAAAHVRALQGNYVQVGLPPNITTGYAASEVGNDGRAGQQGVYVGQEFVTGGKLRLSRSVAAWEVEQAERRYAARRQRVLTDVRTAFYEALIAESRMHVTARLLATGQHAVATVDRLRQGGEASEADLLQAQVEAESAAVLAENAAAAHVGAWRRLAAVVGQPNLPAQPLAGDVASMGGMAPFDEVLGRILGGSPELAAAYAAVERARWGVNRARAQVVPNVDVQGTAQYDYASEYTVAGVQATFPVPLWNRNQGAIMQAQAEVVAAENGAARLELDLRKRLSDSYQRYEIARQQAERYSLSILPKVQQTLDLTTAAYNAGEVGFLQLLTAQRTYFQSNLAYLDSLGNLWKAVQEIEGYLLADSLGTDEKKN
jgi:cobalt-zinc-cadmium efflux system outer membrane protein